MLRKSLHFSLLASVATIAGCGGSIPVANDPPISQQSCNRAASSSASVSCPTRVQVAGVGLAGKVEAGLQPVSGATVQLYAAGIAGNGSAGAALLATPALTNANGTFTIPGGYACPSADTPIYLLSRGGQRNGSGPNQFLWLMTALGPCNNIPAGSTFVLDEVTTVAAAWALSAFMSVGGNVGASCTNGTGLNNAFLVANGLVNTSTGTSPGVGISSTLSVPASKLNTLANAIGSCAVSDGGGACISLFNAAVSGNGTPNNTLDAALNIAHLPGNTVPAIYTLAAGSAVFSPALAAAPQDWMLHNTISGGGMNLPASVSVAASGIVWVSSYFDAVSEFLPTGAAVFPAGVTGNGINQSYGMALDAQGNVWIANEQTTLNSGTGEVTELNSSGQAVASEITGGGIDFPIAAAADSNGNMWFADYGDSKVTLLSSSGMPISSAGGWGGTSLAYPVALAIDADHNVWVASQGGKLPITKISADGSQIASFNCDCDGASGVAIDQSGNAWIANYYSDSISEVDGCGTLVLDAITGGGVRRPQGITVDGAGTVWVTNFLGNSLSEIGGASGATHGKFLSPTSGFGTDASLLEPYGLAVDASGNIWVSNSGNNTLTQFIGVAAPVKVPMAGPPQLP